jgi:hypothetical protein
LPQGVVKPSNQTVAYGDPLMVEMEIGANATAAEMKAGRVVIFDDADQTVKESGAAAANVVGFLEVDPAKTKSTAYAVGDQAKVVIGECLAVLTLLANEAVTRGDALVTAANGKLAKQAVGAMGAQGQVVAYAWESSNVAQDAEILVHWKPSGEPAAAA